MNRKRQIRLIDIALDEWGKELYWRAELLYRRKWTLIKESDLRASSLEAKARELIEQVLFPDEDGFNQLVQESLL